MALWSYFAKRCSREWKHLGLTFRTEVANLNLAKKWKEGLGRGFRRKSGSHYQQRVEKKKGKRTRAGWETDVQEPVHPSSQHPKPSTVLQSLRDDMKGWRVEALNMLGVLMPGERCWVLAKRGREWGSSRVRLARRDARGEKGEERGPGSRAVTRVVLAAKGGIHRPQ